MICKRLKRIESFLSFLSHNYKKANYFELLNFILSINFSLYSCRISWICHFVFFHLNTAYIEHTTQICTIDIFTFKYVRNAWYLFYHCLFTIKSSSYNITKWNLFSLRYLSMQVILFLLFNLSVNIVCLSF